MTAAPRPNEAAPRPTNDVLVVDDDDLMRDLLVEALSDGPYRVRTARDGLEALAVLAGSWRPDLILLDLMMPNMDGWAFRARQLALAEIADIPVIVLSAGPNLRHGVDALGAAVIVPKPFDLDLLLNIVAHLIGRERPRPS